LLEDLGRAGDITTDAVIPADQIATATVLARAPGRIAGLDIALCAFRCLDDAITAEIIVADGGDVRPEGTVATLRGNARALLTGERVALNFLGHLSGIATATRDMTMAAGDFAGHIACTRKTTPGLRTLQKYAVRMGGAHNHRFGLDDAVLIKDNHIAVAGGITAAVTRVRDQVGHMVKIQVEVDTLAQLAELLPLGVDAVLLDNMTPDTMREAVALIDGRLTAEASGGITPDSVAAVAASGVDLISVGWLTHSAPNLDLSLDIALDA
jgi:nicotinate-nucleotide pyrophosphorylase (carboxylating)